MIEQFTNLYPLSKNLMFKLIPQGETLENIKKNGLLTCDEKRGENYVVVKELMDRYHKLFADEILSSGTIIPKRLLDRYAVLYYMKDKEDSEIKEMAECESEMREVISKAFRNDPRYVELFGKEVLKKYLPLVTETKEEEDAISSFDRFFTFFTGFNRVRQNLYVADDKAGSIPFRCINENLPIFLDNIRSFDHIIASLPKSDVKQLEKDSKTDLGLTVKDHFTTDYFNFVLSEFGIEEYNHIIGGYSKEDGTKVKGINEYVNLYNQQLSANDKSQRLPFLKNLYKQMLSDRSTFSFIPDKLTSDQEALDAVRIWFSKAEGKEADLWKCISGTNYSVTELFKAISAYDTDKIWIKKISLSDMSLLLTGSWSTLRERWADAYDREHGKTKKTEKYYEKRDKTFRAIQSMSIKEISETMGIDLSKVAEKLKKRSSELCTAIKDTFAVYDKAVSKAKAPNLKGNEPLVSKLKNLLDAVKDLESFLKMFSGTGKEEEKDELFYGDFLLSLAYVTSIDRLYEQIRNYVTSKPYSTDKIKLTFNHYQLLSGWSDETVSLSVFLRKGDKYYLGILDKESKAVFGMIPEADGDDCYEKMDLKYLPGPEKMLPKMFIRSSKATPDDNILRIYNSGTFTKANFVKKDCEAYIEYCQNCILENEAWQSFEFKFKAPKDYEDISEFYADVANQGYKVTFRKYAASDIDKLVKSGKLYLFQLYSKDFSEHSRGNKNLHTLYFQMLFDERNLKDVVYQLNGGAEVFFRPASIKPEKRTIHKAGDVLENKNPLNEKRTSQFDYDIIKDRRYTVDQFELHLPFTINFKARTHQNVNIMVRSQLKQKKEQYFIGVKRGERHLVYICVINSKGEIVEERSLNTITSKEREVTHVVDYFGLLDARESERDEARKDWQTIKNIKELKSGYLSQVIRQICELVVKYDAVIIMEDMDTRFKQSRAKIEKQVYQQFEKALIDKLNFLVLDKNADPESIGGLLHGYQLTAPFESFSKMGKQTGIIFYMPASLTTNIDPVTGFTNLFPKLTTDAEIRKCISEMDAISYDDEGDMFEFDFNYARISCCRTPIDRVWSAYTYGERIIAKRSDKDKDKVERESVYLTSMFKELFSNAGIDYEDQGDLKNVIIGQKGKFVREFWNLFMTTLQLRNSDFATGRDYIISPIEYNGEFFESENTYDTLPCNPDANGAFNIARKGIWAYNQIRTADDIWKAKLAISNRDWLEMVQFGCKPRS